MAPRKRLVREEADGQVKPDETKRVTRSSALRALRGEPEPEPAPQPKKRKAAVVKEGGEDAVKEAVAESEDPQAENAKEAQRVAVAVEKKEKTVVIEHCKQCNSFKTRAVQVKNGLEAGVPGITVLVNPEKPRRGCFEIREEDGEKFVSLLDMKRPFKPMKELDMETVISDIISKLNGE